MHGRLTKSNLQKSEVSTEDLKKAEGIVAGLNPGARVIITDWSKLCATKVLATGLFDFETVEDMPGWAALEDPAWVSKVASCDVRHFLYKRDRPFHPGRLVTLLGNREETLHPMGHSPSLPRQLGLTRSKGIFWLATRSTHVGEWQHAGSLYREFR